MKWIYLAESAFVSLQQFSCFVSIAESKTFSYLIACLINNAVHNSRIEAEDDNFRMPKFFEESEGVCEAWPGRILRNQIHKPTGFFSSLKNTLVVFA